MTRIEFDIDGQVFISDLLADEASRTVEALREFLPLESELMFPEIPRENHTVCPSRGDILRYPGYRNEGDTHPLRPDVLREPRR